MISNPASQAGHRGEALVAHCRAAKAAVIGVDGGNVLR